MKYSELVALGFRFLFAKMINQRVPFQVHIRLLEQCDKRCSYCIGDYPTRGQKPLTTKQLLEVIDGFVRLGTKRFTLFGGEPLLREDIGKIVRRIKDHKVNCSIITNGSVIDKHIELLGNLDLLTVSLDGDRQCHDAYRGGGSYDEALHAIEVARNKDIPVQLICTITRLTDPKLSHLIEIAQRYNCTIDFEQLNPLFNADGTTTLRPEDAGAEGIAALIDYQLKHKNSRVVNSAYALKCVRQWPVPYRTFRLLRDQIPFNSKVIHCYGGRFSAVVEANGDLLPCCLIRHNYHPVNVFELGLEKAWQQMPENNCSACRSIGYSMFNAIFSLHPGTLLHFSNKRIRSKF